jgi:hypothetical protein
MRTLSLREVLEKAVDSSARALRVAMPARVEKYDAGRQSVDVKPLVQDWYEDEQGARRSVSIPVISQVPVVFPGAGGFRLTFPIQSGDTVLLVFTDRSIDKWLHAGGEVDPVDIRMHQLSDAVAIPGLHPFTSSWTSASTSAATLGRDDGPQISLTAEAIELGGNSDAVALASKVLSALGGIVTSFNGHTHLSAAAGSPTGPPAPQLSAPDDVASATVKAVD